MARSVQATSRECGRWRSRRTGRYGVNEQKKAPNATQCLLLFGVWLGPPRKEQSFAAAFQAGVSLWLSPSLSSPTSDPQAITSDIHGREAAAGSAGTEAFRRHGADAYSL